MLLPRYSRRLAQACQRHPQRLPRNDACRAAVRLRLVVDFDQVKSRGTRRLRFFYLLLVALPATPRFQASGKELVKRPHRRHRHWLSQVTGSRFPLTSSRWLSLFWERTAGGSVMDADLTCRDRRGIIRKNYRSHRRIDRWLADATYGMRTCADARSSSTGSTRR